MKSLQQIASELQGYDPEALRADAVSDFLARLVEPVTETETVGVLEALGRVLADDLISPISVPAHDNSAMDGYAFAGAQLQPGAALTLRVAGTALAGRAWHGQLAEGECVKIMTGAVMPAGLDTVVPFELAHADGGLLTIPADAVRPGANRRLRGEDLLAGQPALRAGERLGPAALGLVASLGLAQVTVRRRVRVAYFSTGDELLSLGEAPREGAVYDSNRYTVFGLLTRLGIEVLDLGLVADDPAALEAALRRAVHEADAVITSGGVSVGEADHTKAIMKQLGDVAFWRIAMRPGRPMAVGRLQQDGHSALLFGLPGNPVATMVTFLAFVRPALLQLMGARARAPLLVPARSLEAMRKKPGRTEYQRGIVSRAADGSLQVRTTGNQGSGVLRSMAEANCLIVLGHEQGSVAAGDEVGVLLFEGTI
ncbi:MAG: Molybdopterin molybdenumtransferase [Pseudomonadota bacterium]|jgi:molybdopterin molybdotransferase